MKPETGKTSAKTLLAAISLPLVTLLIMGVLIGCDIIGGQNPINPTTPQASFKVSIKGNALVGGKINFGGKLTVAVTDNKLAGKPINYQWTRDGNPISGATKEEYTILKTDEDKTISVNVTIENETVAATGIAIPKRAITIAIGGSAFNDKGIVGKEGALKAEATRNWVAEDKDGNELPTTYQWVRESANISGATKEEYVLTADDAGKTLTCKVGYDSVSGTSSGIKIPTASTQTKTLEVSIIVKNGTPQVGGLLTVDITKNFSSGMTTYEWLWNGQEQVGADSEYYLEPRDWGKAITVKVTCGDTSKESSPITMQSPLSYTVIIEPEPLYGSLYAEVYIEGYWQQPVLASIQEGFEIKWFRGNETSPISTTYQYDPDERTDAGKKIKAIVSGGGKRDISSNVIEMPPASLLGSWIASIDDNYQGSHYVGTSTLNFFNLTKWNIRTETETETNSAGGTYTINGDNFVLYCYDFYSGYYGYDKYVFCEGKIGDNTVVLLNPDGEDLVFTPYDD